MAKKLKFLTDYSPRKKGEVVEVEDKIADWYLSNQLAEIYECNCEDDSKEKCSECEEQAKAKKATPKKKATKKTIKKVDE